MAGAPGLEIWGPYGQHGKIRDAVLEAGGEARRELLHPVLHAALDLERVPRPLDGVLAHV